MKAYTGGLNFTWPTKGDTNWDDEADVALTNVSGHTHDGVNGGAQISTSGLAANAVNGTKLRLANNEALRARNQAGNADVDLLKLTTGDLLSLLRVFIFGSTETLTSSGAISLTTTVTVLNGSSIAMTLANGTEGQVKLVVNINSTTATVTPATTSGANMLSLGQHGAALLTYIGSEWRAMVSPRVQVSDDSQSFSGAGTWDGFTSLVVCTGTTYTVTTPNGVEGQTVMVRNQASGNVTFGGQVMATGTYYLYSYLNAGWRRVALT